MSLPGAKLVVADVQVTDPLDAAPPPVLLTDIDADGVPAHTDGQLPPVPASPPLPAPPPVAEEDAHVEGTEDVPALADDQIDFLAAGLDDGPPGPMDAADGPGAPEIDMDLDMDAGPMGDDGWPEGGQHELKRVKVRALQPRRRRRCRRAC